MSFESKCRCWSLLLPLTLGAIETAADIVAVGGAVVLREPPPSILHNQWESDVEIRGWLEREIVLPADRTLGHVEPGFVDDLEDLVNGVVPSGTAVRSYMVRADPVGVGPVQIAGYVVFDTPILGVLIGSQLGPTDTLFARPGIVYNANPYRGLELDGDGDSMDSFEISPDRLRIDFVMEIGEWTDDIRIVTSVVPQCVADYNSDEAVDILDFLDFFQDFSECDSAPSPCGTLGNPDINGDTVTDILDFLDFFEAFSTGC